MNIENSKYQHGQRSQLEILGKNTAQKLNRQDQELYQENFISNTGGRNSDFGTIKSLYRNGRVPGNKNRTPLNQAIENHWKSIEKSYRMRYPQLTDQDVNFRPGQFECMAIRIAKRTNRSFYQIVDEIRCWRF